mgnify:CR=1 FL=1
MENEIRKKKTTAPDTSVGADDGQPLHNSTENSISTFEQEINGDFQNSAESLDEIYRRMQRLTDPHYLHTISMTELYQTAYQSRPPIIDGLLYAAHTSSQERRRLASHFWWRRSPTMSAPGRICGATRFIKEQSSILLWKMMKAVCSAGCSVCLV